MSSLVVPLHRYRVRYSYLQWYLTSDFRLGQRRVERSWDRESQRPVDPTSSSDQERIAGELRFEYAAIGIPGLTIIEVVNLDPVT